MKKLLCGCALLALTACAPGYYNDGGYAGGGYAPDAGYYGGGYGYPGYSYPSGGVSLNVSESNYDYSHSYRRYVRHDNHPEAYHPNWHPAAHAAPADNHPEPQPHHDDAHHHDNGANDHDAHGDWHDHH